jgi:ABC-2 type transport system ATP-binding protein
MLELQDGTIELNGQSVSPKSRAYRRQVGVVFQSAALDLKLSVAENLGLTATLYGFGGAEAKQRIGEALEIARLTDRAADVVGTLSGGMRRRLDIARALLPEPKILLMDEPTTGLDEASYRALWEHLGESNRRAGTTIVVSTHRPDEAARCDRLCVLHEGAVVATDTPEALRSGLADDLVVITCDQPLKVRTTLREAGFAAEESEGGVTIGCEDGHSVVPRIFEALPAGAISAVAVRRPGLADAFLALTGSSLDGEPAEAA